MRYLDLNEGPNDPNIFKAVILAGGPGSGKSYVQKAMALPAMGLRTINSDDALEYLMNKQGLDLTMPPEELDARTQARQRAKEITATKKALSLDGRLGIVIDGTAKDVNKVARIKQSLEQLGYQVMMLFVNTNLRTAMTRNNMRARRVPAEIVVAAHKETQANKLALQNLFGNNYVEVNNDGIPDFTTAQKQVNKFLQAPLGPVARDWISKAHVTKIAATKPAPANKDLAEDVTQDQLKQIETYADVLFNKVGINVEFTRHFMDRVNDTRNAKPINTAELIRLFKKEYAKWGKPIARLGPDAEAVMRDMQTDVNMPFVINWDRRTQQLDLVAKTVMRKANFKTPDPVFAVEAVGSIKIPQVLYHGNQGGIDTNNLQMPMWFSTSKVSVRHYIGGDGYLVVVRPTLNNPYRAGIDGNLEANTARERWRELAAKGYDSIVHQVGARTQDWVIFDPASVTVLDKISIDETIIFPIPRNKMPQVDMDHVEDDFRVRRGTVSFKKLRPVQTERVPGLVDKTVAMLLGGKIDKPIMVDRNGYIVNGHHRYDAYKKLGAAPDYPVPVIMIYATLEDIIDKYSHTASNEPVVTESSSDTTFAGKDPMSFKSPNGGTPTMLLVTAQGSRYLIASDGMVLRNKSFHANTGGDDQGLKDWSSAIEFYDPSEKPGGVPFALSVAKAVEKKLPVALTDTKNGKRALLIYDGSQWRVAKISDIYKYVTSIDAPIVATYSKSPKLNWNVLDYDIDSSKRIVRAHPGSPVTHGVSLSENAVRASNEPVVTEANMKKNKWGLIVSDADKAQWGEELMTLVNNAYQHTSLGSFVQSMYAVNGSEWAALDWDQDPDLDCTIFYRKNRGNETWTGFKVQGIGHDGSPESKQKIMSRLVLSLNKPGYWIESSDSMARALAKRGAKPVTDEAVCQAVFPNTNLKMLDPDTGLYQREAGGAVVKEIIYGNPRPVSTVSETCSGSIATVVAPLGKMQRRPNASIYSSIADLPRKKKK